MRVYNAQPDGALREHLHEKLVIWKRGDELAALNLGGWETRNDSILKLVEHADHEHGLPPFGPLFVHTGDQPINAGDHSWRALSFSHADTYLDVSVPDFLFDGWPQVGLGDYEDASAAARQAGAVAAERERLGWIGNCDTHPVRWELHALGAANPELLEIDHVSWVQQAGSDRLATERDNQLTLAEQVQRWALLLDIEGRGWSARLKLLLHSGRPVLLQERPWREWYWSALEPMEHFIPVRRDLSDLVKQTRWALEHPDEAAAIGRAGQAFAQAHLTRQAAVERWAQTITDVVNDPAPEYGPPVVRAVLDPVLSQLGAL